jgi:hypothetical protein
MKLMITTQYRENYGTEAEPYWKFKGGVDYFIANVDPLKVAPGLLVEQVRGEIEYSGTMSEEYILDWELVADDHLTDFEKSQLEYDGEIRFPAKELFLVEDPRAYAEESADLDAVHYGRS